VRVEPAAEVSGHVAVPGDKSISHRSVLLGALGEGETNVRGFLRAGDTQATVDAVRAFGVQVDDVSEDELTVHGVGLRGLRGGTADCANAGTLLRLITGVVAGQTGRYVLTGDESLSSRPMERVAEPLRQMGAQIETTDGHAPVLVEGSDSLEGITYQLPVASAQVKSAILLAGLNASSPTTVGEPRPTRDHTELMLQAAGVGVRRKPAGVTIEPAGALRLGEVDVPGDFSSAAPLLAAAAIVPGSDLTIHDVGLNPRRTGLLDVLDRMGAHVVVFNKHHVAGELVGDVTIKYTDLDGVEVTAEEVPLLVDELPLVALLASHARGDSIVRGAEELRLKETDRIEAVTDGLKALGARIRSRPDGWIVTGVPRRLKGGRMDARGDHRIAMLGAVAGLSSREGVDILGAETVAISFPGFFDLLESVVRR